jgi:hypothetical protein
MGDILKHITELIEEHGRPKEERRPSNLPNFFDALDGCAVARVDSAPNHITGPGCKREQEKKSDLNGKA